MTDSITLLADVDHTHSQHIDEKGTHDMNFNTASSMFGIVGAFALSLVLFGCGSSNPRPHEPTRIQSAREPAGGESVEGWDRAHPEAARELGAWVREHPDAAEAFFEWDGSHSERAREFTTWAIRHPGENIDGFVLEHRNWEDFNRIMERHRPAAESFTVWARRNGQAAEALLDHPRGLKWAGDHLYAADRRMNDARR